MASLIFAHAKSIVKSAKREAKSAARLGEQMGKDYHEQYKFWYEWHIERSRDEFDEYLEVAQQLHGQYLNAIGNKQAYFITIRPDCNKVMFDDFKDKVESFVQRACFIDYTYSFEQKGTTASDMGTGFHCHIVTQSKHRSKGECLRDTLSSWKKWIDDGLIAPNCIDVGITKNPDTLIQNYLIDYKSDDDHKLPTKSMDELWRYTLDIKPLYKKGVTQANSLS